ncbi:MAG: hypothetical protein RIS47_1018 [Bacteroidota bacterium]
MFYVDGFRGMKQGRTLWLIIGLKLLIMYGVFKLFFFPNKLQQDFDNDAQRSEYVLDRLTNVK